MKSIQELQHHNKSKQRARASLFYIVNHFGPKLLPGYKGHVIARLLDIPELLSTYKRYVKAKHESIDSKLLPGYKGHVIARLLDIPELVLAYMRYVKA
ncbi:hypothetical protein E3N88_34735 [Mikania micrantha]|uniref:Uncharacterized protein n=1 Tax=Mikania micrantha TaxID=192012 RepID=A0A5N6LZ06_9ASTR|nr:hypothetical protein E3N88_34735 [Mikania micrantha]